MVVLKLLALLGGMIGIVFTIGSALRTFVLPRAENTLISRFVFDSIYRLFLISLWRAKTYEQRDRALAFFIPVTLFILPIVYLGLAILAYTPIYWALGSPSLYDALWLSGSSLLTLGYAPLPLDDIPVMVLSFSQAALGMILVALLIAYLPTIYSAFSQREKQVALLEVRAGSPPSGVVLISRVYRNRGDAEYLTEVWDRWEQWFAEIEENHTSLVALVFLRSPLPERHWVTAAGAVLDAAALMASVVDVPRPVENPLMIRAGYVALRRIAEFFGIPFDPSPNPDDPISITREEFDEACDELLANGVPLKSDRDQAWRDYAGWRVNYDRPLIGLARLTAAPYAPWSSDRSLPDMQKIKG